MFDEFLVGDTIKITWINSAVSSPDAMTYAIRNGDDTVVSSGTLISSGNGHYYRYYTVETPGFYVSDSIMTVSGLPFKRSKIFKAVVLEVD